MNIIDNRQENNFTFGHTKFGDVFEVTGREGSIFMKLQISCFGGEVFNAWDLTQKDYCRFEIDDAVTPLKASLVIER